MRTLRVSKAEIPSQLRESMIKQFGAVAEPVEVTWHNPKVAQAALEFGAKIAAWDAADDSLKTFAHMAVAAQVGGSWCLDINYFQAQNQNLDLAKASQVPRWRESERFTPLERDVLEVLCRPVIGGDTFRQPASVRAIESQGMLCSASELGLSQEAEGLFVLPSDAPPGADLRDLLALDDTVLTLKLTPNRGDCLGLLGIARELAAFQVLSDGQAKPRNELIRELADQWIVRGEANTAKFAFPSADEIENAYRQFVKQFPSSEEFQKRLNAADLTEAAVKRILAQQLYLAHFLEYRFRAAAQIDDQEVEKYYNDEFGLNEEGTEEMEILDA